MLNGAGAWAPGTAADADMDIVARPRPPRQAAITNLARAMEATRPAAVLPRTSLLCLPDEIVLRTLVFLDVPDLLNTSRVGFTLRLSGSSHGRVSTIDQSFPRLVTGQCANCRSQSCHRLRVLSLDPLLHKWRRRYSLDRVGFLLPRRPVLQALQPPVSTIYLTRTHVAARRLHWSLVSIRLNRSLSRRPNPTSLVSANILPRECYAVDRRSGEFVWSSGVAGGLAERRRRVEREQIKENLCVWLDRKAREIRARRRDGEEDVGILVWRFSRKAKVNEAPKTPLETRTHEKHARGKVLGLRRFFEGLGSSRFAA